MGVGPTEIVIVGLILLVLFGPTLVAFFLGYTLGKKKAAEASPGANSPEPETLPAPLVEPELPPSTDSTSELEERHPDE